MRKSLILLGFFYLVIGLVGCKEDTPVVEDPEGPAPELSVDTQNLEFAPEGGSQTLKITSNTKWSFEFDADGWVRPTIQTSKGDASVTITADPNEDTSTRAAEITLVVEGLDDLKISVGQEGKEEGETEEEPVLEDYIDPDNTGMRNLTSLELSQEMGIGWNLGNSLEAMIVNGEELSGGETSWGNAATSRALIDAVKAAGFNTIRIPVSWSHKFDDPETYDISYEWKLRVEEVINYALDNNMYVMINIHWDGGWLDQPFYQDQDELNERLAIMWKQIAKFFRDYDDHLLFAGTNEVHIEGDYSAPDQENVDVQNSFNQTFVNTVRATGGRNAYRHLVVQTFNTNIDHGVNHFIIPEDDAEDRLMVEVHYYDPYPFTLDENSGVYLWGEEHAGSAAHAGWGDEEWVDTKFGEVKSTWVDSGYPVILGEYASTLRSELSSAALDLHVKSRNHYLNYVTKSALEHGMIPVYWDNGHTGNLGSGLFNRATGSIGHPDALEALVSALDD